MEHSRDLEPDSLLGSPQISRLFMALKDHYKFTTVRHWDLTWVS
jgi:hypothetical protein